jgi:hypothetical protein
LDGSATLHFLNGYLVSRIPFSADASRSGKMLSTGFVPSKKAFPAESLASGRLATSIFNISLFAINKAKPDISFDLHDLLNRRKKKSLKMQQDHPIKILTQVRNKPKQLRSVLEESEFLQLRN